MCAGCGSYAGDDAPGTGFGCAPKTPGPGPGPSGSECPFSRQCNYDCLQSTPEFPYFGHPQGLDEGHQHWHYFLDPCANYDTQNMSAYGLGCSRVRTPSRSDAYRFSFAAAASREEGQAFCSTSMHASMNASALLCSGATGYGYYTIRPLDLID